MRIVISEFMDDAAVDQLRARFDVVYDPDLVDRTDDLLAEVTGARALIVRNRTKVTGQVLEAGADLACVGRLGVGLDNIDLDACKARDVTVYPATGANNLSVAEYVITQALVLLRGAYQAQDRMLEGAWPRQACSGCEISGKVLGLVGFGAIAQQTAAMACAMGMNVVAYDPFLPADDAAWAGAQQVALDAVLRDADVVSLHTPLTPDTRHLINAAALKSMKPSAVLVNAARGGVVDDAAFAAAVRDGEIAGGALDVFETEPLTAEAANMFDGLSNVILTPHIAGVTQESNVRVSGLIADRVAQHLAG